MTNIEILHCNIYVYLQYLDIAAKISFTDGQKLI